MGIYFGFRSDIVIVIKGVLFVLEYFIWGIFDYFSVFGIIVIFFVGLCDF